MDYKIKIKHINESCNLVKTPKDAHSFLLSKIATNFPNSDLVYIAQNDVEMESIQKQLSFLAPELEILNLYAWDCMPYDRVSPKNSILSDRIKTLYQLATRKEGKRFCIITSVNSALQKTVAPNQIKSLGLYIQTGSKISLTDVSKFLISKGYNREACANDVGDFAVRGGIIDVVLHQAADLVGYRLDFFGNDVESIKIFDPVTQLTQESVKSLEILPASEVIMNDDTVNNFRKEYRDHFGAAIDDQLYAAVSDMRSYPGMEHWLPFFYAEKLSSFYDYLENPVTFFDNEILDLATQRCNLIEDYYQTRIEEKKIRGATIYNPTHPDLLYLKQDELEKIIRTNTAICFNQFETADKTQRNLDLEIKPIPDFALAGRANKKDPISLMQEFVFAWGDIKAMLDSEDSPQLDLHLSKPSKLLIACLTRSFLEKAAKMLPDYDIHTRELLEFSDLDKGKSSKTPICTLPIHLGFYTSDLMVIGEQAIFGPKIVRKKSSKAATQRLVEEGLSINLGELIVHRDHGIGKFDGIHTIEAASIKTDMIKIIYGNNDTLFVPVDDINLITRYGSDNPLIQLDRLGVATWKNRRDKVKKKIKIAAEHLLKIAAARHIKKAPIFSPDQNFYDEFKSKFGFVETDDQLKAIDEVEEDLRKGSPMDRLICGDVGFGKTEVALRTAALVVGSDKVSQIALISPTTLLTRQHFKNFSKRFEGTGIEIAQLSRLVGTAETRKVKEGLASGKVRIVIGTHSLLQKTIKFKNLSLIIVDEEQHFGVAQKEVLKEMRNEVHMLALSATPIPRTLQMSLTGVKDLSLIATPPSDRLAVRNFVMPYDSVVVREAIMREYNRSGRVFFVVPRITDINEMEARLRILVPEIKITHAHGRMTPTELDKIMNDFVDGKIDMLLSTTIIESGIDVSQANTMIIYRAEMFGLSQLYQLRGRVGRGNLRAYCYFMLDNRKKISRESKKKLDVMQNLDSLGVGFSIASHDMDIRGSGNLLGDEQSGHVRETGVELYQQMLLETIEKLKNTGGKIEKADMDVDIDFSTQVKLGISLLIPEEYMSDLSLRMSFYKKIASIKNDDDQEILMNEMSDRFGSIPTEVDNLMKVSKLKSVCKKIGIERLEVVSSGILISFKDNKFAAPEALMKLIMESKGQVKIQSGQKVLHVKNVRSLEDKIASSFAVIETLSSII